MRHLQSCTTAMLGAFLAFGSTGAMAGAGHSAAGPAAYRPLPPRSGVHSAPNVVYGSRGFGAGGMNRQGPAVYTVHGRSPLVQRAADEHRRRFAGGDRGGRYDRSERAGRGFLRYGYGLAAVGGAAGYGYGSGYGYEDGAYNTYGSVDAPLTVGYGEAPVQPVSSDVAYGYGQQLSGGDDVQTNGYASPYNPDRLGGYVGGYGNGGYNAGTGFSYAIPPAGGLAVYSPGAYGPGPRIIHIPSGYRHGGRTSCTCGYTAHD